MFRPLLIPFAVLAGWIGCAYVFGDPVRTSTPSFAAARELAPMPVWGVMFLIGAATLAVAIVVHDDRLPRWALAIGGVIYIWWGLLFLLTVLRDERASLNAPALYGFIAFIHFLAANPELLDRLRKVGRS
jgi:hypothetical protein